MLMSKKSKLNSTYGEREFDLIPGIIYARYSSHNQKEESIEQQVDECMAFAKANNIEIIHVYADKAVTGKTDNRREFQRMMRDAEKRQFQVVIAYKSNRIARNMLNALQYEARLDMLGIKTLYAKEEFGNTAAGRFALRTMMNVNQFYSENMAEDIKRGMADNAAACKVNGALPLGYVKGPDGRYAINPQEAAIVREIFEKYLSGVTCADIAHDLNMRGVKTKAGNAFNKNSFHRMFTNDAYIGVYRHSGVVKEDGIPPIIEKEVFAAMQEKLVTKKNPVGRHRENGDYLLTGKLYCGYCGSYMVGVSGTGKNGTLHHYYQCQKRRVEKNCKKEHVRRDWIERIVAEYTQAYILQDEVIEWIADSAVSFQAQARRSSNILSIENELADKRKATKNIMTAIEQGIFTETTKSRLLELEANIKELERALLLARAAEQPVEKERIIFTMESLREGNIENKEYQRKLIDTFVKAVYLWDDKIKIEYYHTTKKHRSTYPIEKEDVSIVEAEGAVRTSSPQLHHRRAIRTPCGDGEILIADFGFVLLCPLPRG